MRIGINGTCLWHETKTGVEWYVVSLLENLKNLPASHEHQFFVYYPARLGQGDLEWQKTFPANWHFVGISWWLKYFWTQLALPRQLKKDLIDLLFVPAHVIPFLYKGKAVMTVHDLAFKYFTNAYSAKELKYQDWAVKSAIKKGADFLVPSETTKNDLIKFYQLAPERIHLAYHGFKAQPFVADLSQWVEIRKKHGIAEKYFLTVGRVENKKNNLNMIRAFEVFKKQSGGENYQLLFIGKPGFGFEKIKEAADKSLYKADIKFLGYLLTMELNSLMAGAWVFLFPSLYEGFGFPILEAMSVGVPVITSNYGVMAEIARDGALLVDPSDVLEMANAMKNLAFDEALRQKLISQSKLIYPQYTWQNSAEKTMAAFLKIMS
ncbi:MAG TPA: glycosyltransferase family 1 protein [bacterium]|nr:glycosyltransferase family 1 protein [bacterium]